MVVCFCWAVETDLIAPADGGGTCGGGVGLVMVDDGGERIDGEWGLERPSLAGDGAIIWVGFCSIIFSSSFLLLPLLNPLIKRIGCRPSGETGGGRNPLKRDGKEIRLDKRALQVESQIWLP